MRTFGQHKIFCRETTQKPSQAAVPALLNQRSQDESQRCRFIDLAMKPWELLLFLSSPRRCGICEGKTEARIRTPNISERYPMTAGDSARLSTGPKLFLYVLCGGDLVFQDSGFGFREEREIPLSYSYILDSCLDITLMLQSVCCSLDVSMPQHEKASKSKEFPLMPL
ncbi:Uncharacterized protein DAT39_018156 [Clarias magur]|uniref:Uncharacterized protein n=1 Tax=Clarias magur TaxID=1594786 RepID=A0A8J4XBG4_CLAMG|nr:Uncharacterized protein DAT39_018156 [Clarias magur]